MFGNWNPERIRYTAAVSLVGAMSAYAIFWVVLEGLARTGVWAGYVLGVDLTVAVHAESPLQLFAFLTGAVLLGAALSALLARRHEVMWLYAGALPFFIIDWFLMADVEGFTDYLMGYPALIGYFAGLVPVIAIWQLGDFQSGQPDRLHPRLTPN